MSSREDWRADVLVRTSVAAERLSELGVNVRPRDTKPAVLLDEWISPECGTLLETRIRVAAQEEVGAQ
ncbi:hypothetical protein ACZ91_44255 [Streptomyces regensis]|nr:hypothetical protein ACZ91_44255 [Streptomyces regensis]